MELDRKNHPCTILNIHPHYVSIVTPCSHFEQDKVLEKASNPNTPGMGRLTREIPERPVT
jgi:hypothetical protein